MTEREALLQLATPEPDSTDEGWQEWRDRTTEALRVAAHVEPDGIDPKTVALLADRAERDAARWEAAAVEMERQRNVALREKQEALDEVAKMRARVAAAAEWLIEALDDHAAKIAAEFGVTLPARGCPEDD